MRFPELKEYIENRNHNSCLNRKISIDEFGEIKNCPSMKHSYGNINKTHLSEILKIKEYTNLWDINKDGIKVCKDCEYRNICSDCRAYLADANDIFSKPLKCKNNPYTGVWEESNLNIRTASK